MATKAGVGMSRHHDPNVAGREAAEQALQKAGIAKADFVFVFASMGYDQHSLVRAVREATGWAPLTGCSAEGTINGDVADESNFSVVVTAISSEELRWHNGIARGLVEGDSRAVGKRVAKDLLPDLSAETIGLFVFPDGRLDFGYARDNLDDFFAGLEENLPSERFLPMWGGGAGCEFANGKPPHQYCDDEVISGGVSYALLSGEARPSWAISHTVIPIGGERKVTRSIGNVIHEIDGKPAVEVLEEYLPEHALADDRDWMAYAVSLALCFRVPDYASVNLSEPGATDVVETLIGAGIGIEAGVWTVEDAERLAASGLGDRLTRILVEPGELQLLDSEDKASGAIGLVENIHNALDGYGLTARRLQHGDGEVTWTLLEDAVRRGLDTRIGPEDTLHGPGGERTSGNGALVRAARELGAHTH